MSKRSFNPNDCIGPLNNVKRAMQLTGKPFSKESMLNGLKGCGLPTNSSFWSVFKNSGILQEVSKGQFMFASKDPIYVGVLVRIKAKYREISDRYKSNRAQKSSTPKPEPEETQKESSEGDPKAMTQFVIDLLKEQGYQILAPVGIVYKLL